MTTGQAIKVYRLIWKRYDDFVRIPMDHRLFGEGRFTVEASELEVGDTILVDEKPYRVARMDEAVGDFQGFEFSLTTA